MAPRLAALAATLLAGASATELTKETWDAATAGKTVFVKFFAPWCGHCKSMKPDWDSLMDGYKDNPGILVADVDCIGDGKALCDEHKVQGFPTIKWGDPSDLQEYSGGRDGPAIQAFAEGLGPQCSPGNFELCSDEKKAIIKKFLAMSEDEREQAISEKEGAIAKIEADAKELLDGLQKEYSAANEKKDADEQAIRASGFGVLKSVMAHLNPKPRAKAAAAAETESTAGSGNSLLIPILIFAVIFGVCALIVRKLSQVEDGKKTSGKKAEKKLAKKKN